MFSGLIATDAVREGVRLLKQTGQAAIGAAANYEQLQVAFSTFLGSAAKADKLLEQLTQTAATTPFQQDEIFQAARQLLAFGFEQERVNDLIRDLGDISSGVGQPLSRLTLIFGQIQAKGRLVGQELLQLNELGVNPIEELAQVTGFAAHEIVNLASKGKISADHVAKAFALMTSEGGRFNNLMEKQSETFAGVTSNFRDQVSIILRQFGTELLPTLKEATSDAIEFLKSLDPEKIKSFAQGLVSFVKGFASIVKELALLTAGYVVGTVVQKAYAAGTVLLTKGVKGLSTAMKLNPIGLLFSAIALAIPSIITLTKRLSGTTAVAEEMRGVMKGLRADFFDQSTEIDNLIGVLRNHNSTERERKVVMDQLNALYPDILAKYDLQKGVVQDLVDLEIELKDAILDRIVAERRAEIKKKTFDRVEEIKASDPTFAASGRSFALANQEQKEAIKNQQIEERLKDEEEELKILKETESVIRGNQEAVADATKEQQSSADAAGARRTQLKKELSALSSNELRDIAKTASVDELRANTARDILKAREQEARANAGNAKEIEKAAEALEKYRDSLLKIADDIEKTRIDQVTDPLAKLQAEQKFALDQTKTIFDELRKEARSLNEDVTEIDALEKRTREQISIEFYRKQQELRKEDHEKELASFIERQKIEAQLRNQNIESTTVSDGVNTKDELVRVKILEADIAELDLRGKEYVRDFKAFTNEALQLKADYEAKVAELDNVKIANAQAALDREEAHALAIIDNLKKSSDQTLTLEEFKEQERLKVALFYAKERLKLLDPNSPEAMALSDSIAAIEGTLTDFSQSNIFDTIKKKLAEMLNIDVGTLDAIIGQAGAVFAQLQGLAADNTQLRIEQEKELLEATRERISETQDALAKEIEDAKNGYAANVTAKEEELASLRNEEDKHKKELAKQQKAALKAQLLSDSLTQISSLITMAANVTKTSSLLGPAGIPVALAAIATFLGIFRAFKSAQAKAQALYKGGRIPKEGYTDKDGGRGHRVQDTNIIVGAGEHVLNANTSEAQNEFLTELNKGKWDDIDFLSLVKKIRASHIGPDADRPTMAERYRLKPFKPIGRELAERVNASREAGIKKQAEYEHRLRKEVMKEVMGDVMPKQIDRLISYLDNKEENIPWTDNQIGLISKKKGKTTRRKFSS